MVAEHAVVGLLGGEVGLEAVVGVGEGVHVGLVLAVLGVGGLEGRVGRGPVDRVEEGVPLGRGVFLEPIRDEPLVLVPPGIGNESVFNSGNEIRRLKNSRLLRGYLPLEFVSIKHLG